jgi:hypothetical protein
VTVSKVIAALIFAALLGAIVAVVTIERRPQTYVLPVVKAAVPLADQPAWRLFPLCPVDRRNVPTLPDERKT